MKYHVLDFLACPVDKHFPLRLSAETVVDGGPAASVSYQCQQYCGYLNKELVNDESTEATCHGCYSRNIQAATLFCEQCGSSYRIEDGIPKLIPDESKTGQSSSDIEAKRAEMLARARPDRDTIVSILTSKQHQLMREIEFEAVSRCLAPKGSDIILDARAGYGIFSLPLSRQCRYVVATDITFEVLQAFKEFVFGLTTSYFTAHEKFPEDEVCLIQADLCYLPLRLGFHFSKILSTEVVSHIPGQERIKAITEAQKYLAETGVFVLTVGNDHIFWRLARTVGMTSAPKEAILDMKQYVGYFHKFSRPELTHLLSDGGFFVEKLFGSHILSYLPFGGNERIARLINKLQHAPFSSSFGDILVAKCSRKKRLYNHVR